MCLLALAATDCGPPATALVSRCENVPNGAGDPWRCTLSAERLDAEQTATFKIARGYSLIEVTATLEAAAGAAEVVIDQLPGRSWPLAPGRAVSLSVTVPFDRGLEGFLVRVRPSGGVVERVTGTVNYRARLAE